MALLSMYEGLGQACQDLKHELNSQSSQAPNEAVTKSLERYSRLYKNHVGIDFEDRKELRKQVSERIQMSTASAI